jgi:hypothetical protein
MTFLASVAADATKLPLLFIGQGKIGRVEDTEDGKLKKTFCSISPSCRITLEEEETRRIGFIRSSIANRPI